MMGQHQQTMESGTALRRIVMVVLVAGLMALLMAASAMPALAKAGDGKYGGNDKGQGGGTGGDSPTNGSDKGVSMKDKDYDGGVYNNPHRPVVVVIDDPTLPTPSP
jgi:uncharacterized membrane protein